MKKTIRAVFGALLLLPAVLSAQTVFTDVQVDGTLSVGTPTQIQLKVLDENGSLSLGMGNINALDAYFCTSNSIGSYNSVYATEGSYVFGDNNGINTSSTSNTAVMFFDYIYGINNNIKMASSSFVIGLSNSVNGSYVNDNTYSNAMYMFGSGLLASPSANFSKVIILGFSNKDSSFNTMVESQSPLLILGNGSSGVRSNALVVTKSGKSTFTVKGYTAPASGNMNPTQPVALVVEGSSNLGGQVVLAQRQGDIWMGSFGRTEDQGPAN